MIYQLACTHIQLKFAASPFLPEWGRYPCEKCDLWNRLTNVECREYYIKCNNCRYARWLGSSRDTALARISEHEFKHPAHLMQIDFKVAPEYKARARDKYAGHRVYLFLTKELPVADKRVVIAELPDIPPF